MINRSCDILIVGGGAAGMSAAEAASSSGTTITLVDDNPRLGGQIWRAELGSTRNPRAISLIDALKNGRIELINNAQVFAAGDRCLSAETPNGRIELGYKKLIIATGARERFLPFPGWTLPNVTGAGGMQALVKGGLNVSNKRIVVAGTGALLLAVAAYLKSKGARVVTIVEQAPACRINRFGLGLWRSPSKLIQATALKAGLFGIPYLTGSWVTSVDGTDRVDAVNISSGGKTRSIECDYLACGFHLVPNTELASILGCEIANGTVAVDEFMRTTCENVFCAGEPNGIGGVETSLVEGGIAGYTAAGAEEHARKLFSKRRRARKFGDALNRTFELRDELKSLAASDTIVCRCEDVAYGRLTDFDNFRGAKLQTRCGMGPCQGRICGPATEFLFGWKPGSVRPPIFPVKMENL